jgi:hypothetical protein
VEVVFWRTQYPVEERVGEKGDHSVLYRGRAVGAVAEGKSLKFLEQERTDGLISERFGNGPGLSLSVQIGERCAGRARGAELNCFGERIFLVELRGLPRISEAVAQVPTGPRRQRCNVSFGRVMRSSWKGYI